MPSSSGEPHGHAVLVGELCTRFDEIKILGGIAQELACAGTVFRSTAVMSFGSWYFFVWIFER